MSRTKGFIMDGFAVDLLEGHNGEEPVIAIDALSGQPELPTLVLRSAGEGILYRNGEQFVEVMNINREAFDFLSREGKILIAEVTPEGVSSTYYADVKQLN